MSTHSVLCPNLTTPTTVSQPCCDGCKGDPHFTDEEVRHREVK